MVGSWARHGVGGRSMRVAGRGRVKRFLRPPPGEACPGCSPVCGVVAHCCPPVGGAPYPGGQWLYPAYPGTRSLAGQTGYISPSPVCRRGRCTRPGGRSGYGPGYVPDTAGTAGCGPGCIGGRGAAHGAHPVGGFGSVGGRRFLTGTAEGTTTRSPALTDAHRVLTGGRRLLPAGSARHHEGSGCAWRSLTGRG